MIQQDIEVTTKMNTAHNLDFLQSTQPYMEDFFGFKIGTCHGLYRSTEVAYEILAIVNDQPGNGHLEDVFEYFERSCRRDHKALRVLEIWNERFKKHLISKRGFRADGRDDVIKTFSAIQ
jgi:hypothetical protein